MLADLVRDPCLLSPAHERCPDAPRDLSEGDGPEGGRQSERAKSKSHEEDPDDDGGSSAERVGQDPRGDFEQQNGCLENGSQQDELQGA
jgi:hypothetical protein